jgi:hypothetical protein
MIKRHSFFQPKNILWKIIKITSFYTLYIGIIISVGITGYLYYLAKNLPELTSLINPVYDLPTQIYDRNDTAY